MGTSALVVQVELCFLIRGHKFDPQLRIKVPHVVFPKIFKEKESEKAEVSINNKFIGWKHNSEMDL